MKVPAVTTIVHLDLDSIRCGRRLLQQKRVGELIQSIKAIGLQAPIIVRAKSGGSDETAKKFEILAGQHRYAACRGLNMKTIPCIIQEVDDLRAELITIDENLCRENLTPAQEAKAIARRKEIYEALHPETNAEQLAAAMTRVAKLATLERPRASPRPPPSSPASQNGTSSVPPDAG